MTFHPGIEEQVIPERVTWSKKSGTLTFDYASTDEVDELFSNRLRRRHPNAETLMANADKSPIKRLEKIWIEQPKVTNGGPIHHRMVIHAHSLIRAFEELLEVLDAVGCPVDTTGLHGTFVRQLTKQPEGELSFSEPNVAKPAPAPALR